MASKTVLYAAAHAGFDLSRVPLGGGAAVADHLTQEWSHTRPFNLQVLSPQILAAAPKDKDLVTYSELRYARFCRDFERALTERILTQDPRSHTVLCNDVSEGPDFKRLAERGHALYTIYHVDVVDYMSRVYFYNAVRPETTTRFYSGIERIGLSRWVPDVCKLVWQKQQDSVRYSKGLLVPSQAMKDVLLRCYPGTPSEKIHVLPWGIWPSPPANPETPANVSALRKKYQLSETDTLLLTLSRISPEKGQDRLLKALQVWEKKSTVPSGVVLLICGEAAYMKGRTFMKQLRRLAARLKKTRVHFPGYVSGTQKQTLLSAAHLYLFPSRHESYGLTLMEALQAGLPVIACANHGTGDIVQPSFGRLVEGRTEEAMIQGLQQAMADLMEKKKEWGAMRSAAQRYAADHAFSASAARLASLLQE